jgi:hypothetical protein
MIDADQVTDAFAAVMKTVRRTTNLSAEDFAMSIGWDVQEYIGHERGRWDPGLVTLLEFAHRTKIPPEALLAGVLTFLSSNTATGRWDLRQYHLYRPGWVDDADRVHELPAVVFESVADACANVTSLNAARESEGKPPVTRLSAYALMGHMFLSASMRPWGSDTPDPGQ